MYGINRLLPVIADFVNIGVLEYCTLLIFILLGVQVLASAVLVVLE
jgi:hypothetical protein